MKTIYEKNVNRIKSNKSEANYAKIKLDQNGGCPFLSEEKMCKIQLKLGEDYLSDVCTTYPRVANVVNGVLEKSATLSCPEAARLALLNPKGIEFDEIEESYQIRNMTQFTFDTQDKKFKDRIEKYFWELRIFTIQVLQNRSYALWERMVLLGMFYQKVEEYNQASLIDEIPKLIETYTNIIAEGSLKESLEGIPVQHAIQMALIKEMVDKRLNAKLNSTRYMECFVEMIEGLNFQEDSTVEECIEQYKKLSDEYYLPFMNEHEYIMENYLVNHVYLKLFPFGNFSSMFDAYVMLVCHYSMVKMHLIGMSGYHKGLNTDQIIKLIQSFAKVVEHDQEYLDSIFQWLKENGYINMAYMTIMVKN